MSHLPKSLAAWKEANFKIVLKREIEEMEAGQLPLQQGLSFSSYALDEPHIVHVLSVNDASGLILAKVGIFYSGIVAGCNCSDDPSLVESQDEYCEVQVVIDKTTAQASFSLVRD